MKGLILNGFYSSAGSVRLSGSAALAAAIAVLLTGNPTALELFIYIIITVFSMNAIVSSRKDAANKWNRFELTMPVCRKDIIDCRYLIYLIFTALGVGAALAVSIAGMMIHRTVYPFSGIGNMISMLTLGTGISLLAGSLFYPLLYLCGTDKSEIVLLISVLGSIGLVAAVLHILNCYIQLPDMRVMYFVVFFVGIFAASYGITQCIYNRKDI